MDQETLFTGSKWDILKLLEKAKMSPIELAEKSGTSMANISQQLRFLEMAGIVTSERLPNRDKGQPRILYSLKGNNSFIIATAPGFVEKKICKLTNLKKAILKTWFYEKEEQQYAIQKAIFEISKNLEQISSIHIDKSDFSGITLTITSDKEIKQPTIEVKDPEGKKFTIKFRQLKKEQLKEENRYYPIYESDIKIKT